MTRYAIQFDFEEGTLYAGRHKGALGWAPTLLTALICDTEEEAQRWLENGYGAAKQYGRVIEVEQDDPRVNPQHDGLDHWRTEQYVRDLA